MFAAEKPEIAGTLASDTMLQWKEYWMYPCLMAAAILVLFGLAFWEKTTPAEEDPKPAEPAAE